MHLRVSVLTKDRTADATPERAVSPSRTTRIVVVDDHEILRKGIVQLLEGTGEYEVVGEAATAAEAHEVIRVATPDLVIADLVLDEGPDGIQLTKGLKAQSPYVPVLLLSAHDESLFAERALDAGASGYVMKDEAVDTLLDAIEVALKGGVWLSEDMWSRLDSAQPTQEVKLTPDQQRAVDEIRRGNWTTQGLAKRLNLSWTEIDHIRRALRAALGLRTDVELVLYTHRR